MGFAVRLALFCALVTGLLATSPSRPLYDLLGRMRAASGPVWRVHLVSTTQLSISGIATTIRTDSLGLRLLTKVCQGALCTGNYFDGRRLFDVGLNGTPVSSSRETDFALRGSRTVASLAFLARDFTIDGGHIEDAGSTRSDGRSLRVLLVANRDATPMQVFVDPVTARVRYARAIGGRTIVGYGAYRKVGRGLSVPMQILRDGKIVQQYDQRRTSPNALTPPRGLALQFAGPNAAIATNPGVSVPIFACTLAGIRARCLLDSGNTGLALSLKLSERLDAHTIGVTQVAGFGHYATAIARVGPLHFGDATIPIANYAVLHDISSDGYDIVLGSDVFAAMRVEINVAAHTVRLDPALSNAGISIPLRFADSIPLVPVRLGTLDTKLEIDTGDESNINLAHDFYQRHSNLFSITAERAVSGVGGTSVESLGRIPSVTIGTYKVADQSIGTTQLLGGFARGHLGAAFFTPFTLILDYAAGRLRLIPAHPLTTKRVGSLGRS